MFEKRYLKIKNYEYKKKTIKNKAPSNYNVNTRNEYIFKLLVLVTALVSSSLFFFYKSLHYFGNE